MYLDYDYFEKQFNYICSEVLNKYIEEGNINSLDELEAEEIRSILSVLVEIPELEFEDANTIYPIIDEDGFRLESRATKNIPINLNIGNAIELVVGFVPLIVPDSLVVRMISLIDVVRMLCNLGRIEIADRDAAVLIFLYKLGADRREVDEDAAFSKLEEIANTDFDEKGDLRFYNACKCEYRDFVSSVTHLEKIGCLEINDGKIKICEKIKGIEHGF